MERIEFWKHESQLNETESIDGEKFHVVLKNEKTTKEMLSISETVLSNEYEIPANESHNEGNFKNTLSVNECSNRVLSIIGENTFLATSPANTSKSEFVNELISNPKLMLTDAESRIMEVNMLSDKNNYSVMNDSTVACALQNEILFNNSQFNNSKNLMLPESYLSSVISGASEEICKISKVESFASLKDTMNSPNTGTFIPNSSQCNRIISLPNYSKSSLKKKRLTEQLAELRSTPVGFKCPHCSKIFVNRWCLLKHSLEHQTFSCSHCPEKFPNEIVLRQHLMLHVMQLTPLSEIQSMCCSLCKMAMCTCEGSKMQSSGTQCVDSVLRQAHIKPQLAKRSKSKFLTKYYDNAFENLHVRLDRFCRTSQFRSQLSKISHKLGNRAYSKTIFKRPTSRKMQKVSLHFPHDRKHFDEPKINPNIPVAVYELLDPPEEGTKKCKLCGDKFDNKSQLTEHLFLHRLKSRERRGLKRNADDEVDALVSKLPKVIINPTLPNHSHPLILEGVCPTTGSHEITPVQSSCSLSCEETSSSKYLYKCVYCPKKMKRERDLRRHLRNTCKEAPKDYIHQVIIPGQTLEDLAAEGKGKFYLLVDSVTSEIVEESPIDSTPVSPINPTPVSPIDPTPSGTKGLQLNAQSLGKLVPQCKFCLMKFDRVREVRKHLVTNCHKISAKIRRRVIDGAALEEVGAIKMINGSQSLPNPESSSTTCKLDRKPILLSYCESIPDTHARKKNNTAYDTIKVWCDDCGKIYRCFADLKRHARYCKKIEPAISTPNFKESRSITISKPAQNEITGCTIENVGESISYNNQTSNLLGTRAKSEHDHADDKLITGINVQQQIEILHTTKTRSPIQIENNCNKFKKIAVDEEIFHSIINDESEIPNNPPLYMQTNLANVDTRHVFGLISEFHEMEDPNKVIVLPSEPAVTWNPSDLALEAEAGTLDGHNLESFAEETISVTDEKKNEVSDVWKVVEADEVDSSDGEAEEISNREAVEVSDGEAKEEFDSEADESLGDEAERASDAEAAQAFDSRADKISDADAEKAHNAKAQKVPDTEAEKAPDADAVKASDAEAEKVSNGEAEKAFDAEAEKASDAEAVKASDAEAEKTSDEAEEAPDSEAEKIHDAEAEKAPDAETEKTHDAEHEKVPNAEPEKAPHVEAEKASDHDAENTSDGESIRNIDEELDILAAEALAVTAAEALDVAAAEALCETAIGVSTVNTIVGCESEFKRLLKETKRSFSEQRNGQSYSKNSCTSSDESVYDDAALESDETLGKSHTDNVTAERRDAVADISTSHVPTGDDLNTFSNLVSNNNVFFISQVNSNVTTRTSVTSNESNKFVDNSSEMTETLSISVAKSAILMENGKQIPDVQKASITANEHCETNNIKSLHESDVASCTPDKMDDQSLATPALIQPVASTPTSCGQGNHNRDDSFIVEELKEEDFFGMNCEMELLEDADDDQSDEDLILEDSSSDLECIS